MNAVLLSRLALLVAVSLSGFRRVNIGITALVCWFFFRVLLGG